MSIRCLVGPSASFLWAGTKTATDALFCRPKRKRLGEMVASVERQTAEMTLNRGAKNGGASEIRKRRGGGGRGGGGATRKGRGGKRGEEAKAKEKDGGGVR